MENLNSKTSNTPDNMTDDQVKIIKLKTQVNHLSNEIKHLTSHVHILSSELSNIKGEMLKNKSGDKTNKNGFGSPSRSNYRPFCGRNPPEVKSHHNLNDPYDEYYHTKEYINFMFLRD